MKKGKLLVLAGPSAVGKGTVAKYMVDHFPNIHLSVSATTRNIRKGESEGVSYFFISNDEFERLVADGQMLEYAEVHGQNQYGTPKAPVMEALEEGKTVILEIDVQGAMQVKAQLPEAITVFIEPPTFEDLAKRLVSRGTESEDEVKTRLQTAKLELSRKPEFDYTVVNDEVDRCAQEVLDLVLSQK
jgi:guanylate kinase